LQLRNIGKKCDCDNKRPFQAEKCVYRCGNCGGWLFIRTSTLAEWDDVQKRYSFNEVAA
jgi:hypothetical protein